MKFSFVVTSLVRSGAETVTVRLATHYANMGHQVEIITLLNNKVEFNLPQDIKIIDFSGKTESRLRRICYWIKSLKRHFKTSAPDIIVSFIARVNLLTLLSTKHIKAPVIISERNDPRYDSRTFITRLLINVLYKRSSKIIFQTDEAKALFNKRIQEKGVVIPNPIKIERIADKDVFDKNLILYAGRFSEQKNVETIINAAEIVVRRHPTVRFELYGDGPLKDNIESLIEEKKLSENVFVFKNIPNIQEKMLNARVFILSSLYEGMSNSLLEASYIGVPCLTTPVLGSYVIKEGVNGYFFNFKDSKKLSELISNLMDEQTYLLLREKSILIAKNAKHANVYELWDNVLLNSKNC